MSSSFINNSVSTLSFIVYNSNLPYIFDNDLHKYLYNIFSSKIKTSDSQENANLCFSPIFPDGEEVYNKHKHQLLSYYPYLQLGTHYLKTAMQYIQILFIYVVHLPEWRFDYYAYCCIHCI